MKTFLIFDRQVIACKAIKRIYEVEKENSVCIELFDNRTIEFNYDSHQMARCALLYVLKELRDV